MSEVLRELVVALSLDSDNFSRNLRTINQQIREAESTFRLAGAGVAGFDKSLKGSEAKLALLSSKQKEQTRAVDQYSRALVLANQKLTDSATRQDKMKSSLTDAKSEYERLRQAVSSAAHQYQQYKSTLGESDSATIAAKANLESFKSECLAARDRVKLLEGQITSNTKTLQNNADAVSKAQTNLNNAKAALQATETELKKQTFEVYRMQSAWTKAGDSMAAFAKKADTASKALVKAGRGYTRSITTPVLALGGAALKSSIDYEYAFANVRKTVDATEAEFSELSAGIKKMSTEVALSGAEIAEVTAVAGQLGIANEHLMGFTRTMVDLGNSTDIVASDAASTLAKFANITNMDQSQFQQLGSALVDLGNNYAATESQILEMSLRLAAAGHQVGLSESQILGFSTALSAVGIEAQMGGSAFSKALVKMEVASATGGDALKDFAKVSGMTADQFKLLWDANPADAFMAFITGLSKLDEQGISAIATLEEIGISEIRLRDTLLRATNATELFSKTQQTANQAWKQNSALTNEAGKRYATTKSRLVNLKNTAMLFAQQVGDDMNPMLQSLIDKTGELLAGFLSMDEGQRMAIIKFAAVAAAIGPALLILGKGIGLVGKVSAGFGTFSKVIGKFSGHVKLAGGGFGGFMKTVGSSKLAVAALGAALVYGAVQLVDYASGAKKAREALQGMDTTAKSWKNTAAETFYASSGLSFFGMDAGAFTRSEKASKQWVTGVLAAWSDGKRKSNDIVKEWTEGFTSLTDQTRSALKELQDTARGMNAEGITAQIDQDLKELDRLDKEVARLLKRKQAGKLSEKDQIKLQSLIDTREAIQVKYDLVPVNEQGFDEIRQKLEAQNARAQAKGQPNAGTAAYEAAIVAAAEGMKSINSQLDSQYEKEYKVISLMQDGADKQAAQRLLDQRYMENRKNAATEYAQLLSEIVMPVWDQKDIQQVDQDVDKLYAKLREYAVAASNGDQLGMANALADMNSLTAGMDEGKLTEYLTLLTQIQSLIDAGFSEAEVETMFPEIDFSGQLEQLASLTSFVQEHKGTLTGLSDMLSVGVPEEVLKIATDLDMTGAQTRWDEFAKNPGAITTQAIIDGYQTPEGSVMQGPSVVAFVEKYTERPEGADKSELSAEGLLAYVAVYAEKTEGADTNRLKPTQITAMVSAYKEMATGADMSTLTPSDISAYISNYLQANDVDMGGITPDNLTAFVMAYEEATGGASTQELKPSDIAAMVTKYLQAANIDITKLTEPQINAIVNAYAEATNCDKSQLKAEVVAQITAYEERPGVQKPDYITSRVSIIGYDLSAYNAFMRNNPVTVNALVRLSEIDTTADGLLQNPQARFWENGIEVPASLVPRDKLDASTLIAYDADGTLHVMITPEVTGDPQAVAKATEDLMKPLITGRFGWQSTNRRIDGGFLNNIFGTNIMDTVTMLTGQVNHFNKYKDSWITLWDVFGQSTKGAENNLKANLSGDALAQLQTYVSEVVAAIKKGEAVSPEDMKNLKKIVNFVDELELGGVGENIVAGIGQAMTDAGWETPAETVAGDLEAALNTALGIQSPSTRMMPIGENTAMGIEEGMKEHDFMDTVQEIAMSIEAAFLSLLTPAFLMPVGYTTIGGLSNGLLSFPMLPSVSQVAARVRTRFATELNTQSLYAVGLATMAGLKDGITAGTSSVVSAIRAAASAAVRAAKDSLDIQSPSRLFRDEVGRMTMRGFVEGVLMETKAQKRTIQNATRFLSESAKESAVAYNSQDNRRTYHQSNSVSLTGNTFHVRDQTDIQALAIEIAQLNRRQQRGLGFGS